MVIDMQTSLNKFFLFSIFGFLFETFLFSLIGMHNQSGFLFFWWTPFYGIGVLIIEGLYYLMLKKVHHTKKRNFFLFILYFFTLSLLEFIGGFLLEALHGYRLWSYEMVALHIGKYISIPTSLVWTVFAFLYLYFVKPFTDRIIKKIPKGITVVLSILFILDLYFTLRKLFIIQIS